MIRHRPNSQLFRPAALGLLLAVFFCPTGLAATDWPSYLEKPAEWYATQAGRDVVAHVIERQHDNGGWGKNYDPTQPLAADKKAGEKKQNSTIDNHATTAELRLLARDFTVTQNPPSKAAFDRGLEFLIGAQYESGGWPQFFPLTGKYNDAITYNDDAMVRVLRLLREVADGSGDFAFVGKTRRDAAARAYDRGIQCILDTQVVVDGKRTVWCAQHDPGTLAPTQARSYEHPSLSGAESVEIVKLLMSIDNPSPRVIEAVQSAVAWFNATKITGVVYDHTTRDDGSKDRRLLPSTDPDDVWWARFYDIKTNRPIFSGRDGVVRYDLGEVEVERRTGYAWYSRRAASLLKSDYPAWQKHWAPRRDVLAR